MNELYMKIKINVIIQRDIDSDSKKNKKNKKQKTKQNKKNPKKSKFNNQTLLEKYLLLHTNS